MRLSRLLVLSFLAGISGVLIVIGIDFPQRTSICFGLAVSTGLTSIIMAIFEATNALANALKRLKK